MPRPTPIDLDTLLAEADWLRAQIHRVLDDPHATEDVVQETWLRALRQPPRCADQPAALRRWLAVVARHLALRWSSRERSRQEREQEVALLFGASDENGEAERRQMHAMLGQQVLALAEPYRTAVLLRYYAGMSTSALADRLDISNAAARQRVARGVAELRRRLGGPRKRTAVVPPPLFDPRRTASPTWPIAGLAVCGLVFSAVWLIWPGGQAPVPTDVRIDSPAAAVDAPAERGEPNATRTLLVERDAVPMEVLRGHVLDSLGQPVFGASVTARPPDRSASSVLGGWGRDTDAEWSTRSDAAGVFTLRLPRGTSVDLRVEAAEHAVAWVPDQPMESSCTVRLGPSGRVRGVVLGVAGAPVEGASLRLGRVWYASGVFREIARSRTGAGGAFSFGHLPKGRYLVDVACSGASESRTVVDLDHGEDASRTVALQAARRVTGQVVDARSGAPVVNATVTATTGRWANDPTSSSVPPEAVGHSWCGASTRTDVQGQFVTMASVGIRPARIVVRAPGYASGAAVLEQGAAEPLRIALVPGVAVTGRCVSSSGLPLAGVAVCAVGRSVAGELVAGGFAEARTDADGRFRLEDLDPAIPHVVLARAPGLGEVWREIVWTAGSDVGTLELEAAGSLAGVVRDAGGNPLRGTYVIAEPVGVAQRVAAGRHLCRTDSQGEFRLGGLGPGGYRVVVPGAGERSVPCLEPGEARTGLNPVVEALPISGVVTDELGVPVVHAAVVLRSEAPGAHRRILRVTCGKGTFHFPAVAPGPYTVKVHPNSLHLPHGDRMVHYVVLHGIPAGSRHLAVALPSAHRITGTVVRNSGAPARRAMVFARDSNGEVLTYENTDERGEFVLRMPPGVVADLYLGPRARQPLLRGVRAGAPPVRLTAPCAGRAGRGGQ
ncbi:MAG: sigma-70 family RNA polymerase sigma factor [Planctomycetes bacterium]|nr:sigma-70 family RNA polymerase sigma factor [Planctomycetota bacterium]MCB9889674.1 sigma-70 family RNA polymerase sigma factor [Planctomycetota bacterium]